MTSKTIELVQDIENLQGIWNKTIKQYNADNVFITYEWLISWIKAFAPNTRQFIICIKENDEIIAIAPLIILLIKEFGIPLNRLQFIGYGSCDYIDFIILKDCRECLDLFFDFIKKHIQLWDYCELHNIPGKSENITFFESMQSTVNCNINLFREYYVCPYLKLDTNIDSILKQIKTGLRYDLKSGERELNKTGELNFKKITDQKNAINEIPVFLEMLHRRGASVNRQRTTKKILEHKQIFNQYIENEVMWKNTFFCKLCVDNIPVAYHFGFEYNRKIYWYIPTFNIDYKKFSPGKIIIKKSIEYALANRFEEFDFLNGDEPYKFQWTTESRENFYLFITSDRLKSRILKHWFLQIRPFLKKLQVFIKRIK